MESKDQIMEFFRQDLKKPYILKSLQAFHDLSEKDKCLAFVFDEVVAANIPGKESHEEIIDLALFLKENSSQCVLAAPGTAEFGAKEANMKFRLSAAKKLLLAEENLKTFSKKNLTFKITDAYRPLSLQRLYFEQIKKEVHDKEGLEGDALYEKVHMLIADPDIYPPHTTGGAIDLTIIDIDSGKELDMGTKIDDMDEKIFSFYPNLTQQQKENRALLFAAMTTAGFVNFPPEWWHYSYGDKEWAMRKGESQAMYAPL